MGSLSNVPQSLRTMIQRIHGSHVRKKSLSLKTSKVCIMWSCMSVLNFIDSSSSLHLTTRCPIQTLTLIVTLSLNPTQTAFKWVTQNKDWPKCPHSDDFSILSTHTHRLVHLYLGSADVAGGFVSADVLLSGLESQTINLFTSRISVYKHWWAKLH